ncbi:MAG: hypothetical protein ABIL69_05105 [candidate division WOR-3 bacterium]
MAEEGLIRLNGQKGKKKARMEIRLLYSHLKFFAVFSALGRHFTIFSPFEPFIRLLLEVE